MKVKENLVSVANKTGYLFLNIFIKIDIYIAVHHDPIILHTNLISMGILAYVFPRVLIIVPWQRYMPLL